MRSVFCFSWVPLFGLSIVSILSAAASEPSTLPVRRDYVELHSHLFMPHGLWPLARDSFDAAPKSENYRERFRSRATGLSLADTDAAIIVASLYSHPWLNRDSRASIRLQLEQAREFITRNSHWKLALSPQEARQAIREKKKVLILHLEGPSEILEREEDLREWIDRGGIRIVTPLHLTDDAFGGCAFLPGVHAAANPLALMLSAFRQLWGAADFTSDPLPIRRNPRGLTPVGEDLVKALSRRRVWIDLAHASDAALERLIPLVKTAGQPFLHTHTALRSEIQAERGISEKHLREVEESGGLIGLMPTEQMLGERPISADLCRFSCAAEECRRGVAAFAREWREARQILSPGAITLGSDHQGGVPGLRPTCGTGTTLDQAQRGYTRMNQSAELFDVLARLKARTPDEGPRGVERFLRAWERVAP